MVVLVSMARLVDIKSGRVFELPAGADEARVLIGRSLRCDVVIDVSGIARQHTFLIRRAGGFWLAGGEEQLSANGTFLNDLSPYADTPLREGDLIRLGDPSMGVALRYEGPSLERAEISVAPTKPRQLSPVAAPPRVLAGSPPVAPSPAPSSPVKVAELPFDSSGPGIRIDVGQCPLHLRVTRGEITSFTAPGSPALGVRAARVLGARPTPRPNCRAEMFGGIWPARITTIRQRAPAAEQTLRFTVATPGAAVGVDMLLTFPFGLVAPGELWRPDLVEPLREVWRRSQLLLADGDVVPVNDGRICYVEDTRLPFCPTLTAIQWDHTGDAEHPYRAWVQSTWWVIRVNDFPEQPSVYSLFIDRREVAQIQRWPRAWTKGSTTG